MTRTNDFNQPIGEAVPDWRAAAMPGGAPMIGHYGRLERLDPSAHGDDLYRACCVDATDDLWTYMTAGPFAERASFDQWLEGIAGKGDPDFYTITDGATGCAQGIASFMRIVPAHGVIEVGSIVFSPAMQRTALATEAMYLMMKEVFEVFGYRRYEWKCDSLNAPSRRAAERLGFVYDGLFEQAIIYKGRNRDTAWYSIMDHRWPKLATAYEAWLAPANFNAEGNQIERLSVLIEAHRERR